MRQTNDELAQNVAERLCWEGARRDDSRVARRLYRKQEVEGVYRLDEGAVLDEFFHFLDQIGVMALLAEVHGRAMQREMVPYVPYVLLYGLKTLFGIDSMQALPALLFSDEALMQLVGFNVQQVRQGLCQRGAATRPGERTPGPISPETLANNIVKLNLRDLEWVVNGAIRALAKTGVFRKQVTGMADGTDLETTARYTGCGHVTRKVRLEDQWGNMQEIEIAVYGWKVLLLIDALTKIPLAVKVGQIPEHETHWTRALVTQARANLAGHARLQKVVVDQGLLAGTDLWWLDQQSLTFVVPAKTNMAVTADARAQAMAGEGITVGRRAPWAGQNGPHRTSGDRGGGDHGADHLCPVWDPRAWAPGQSPRFPGHPPQCGGGPSVAWERLWARGQNSLPDACSVQQPLQPFDDDDDRSLIEHCCIKEAKQPWELGHPPQKTARAVRVHVLFTLLMFAPATAYRLQCERAATGGEPVGWRRQLLEQTRDLVIVFAQGY
jgi:hypothetical protein